MTVGRRWRAGLRVSAVVAVLGTVLVSVAAAGAIATVATPELAPGWAPPVLAPPTFAPASTMRQVSGPVDPEAPEPPPSGSPPPTADPPPVAVPDAPPGAGDPAPGAGYAWPLLPVPAVLTPFRAPAQPYGPGHRGVDLAGAPGQPVLAARAGTVVFAGPVAGRGVVSVQHDDGLRTTYEPVRPAVRAGAVLRAGDVVGLLEPGHRGCAAPACLHWGARRDRIEYVDPLVLLRSPRVRLLPVPIPWPLTDVALTRAKITGPSRSAARSDRFRAQPLIIGPAPAHARGCACS